VARNFVAASSQHLLAASAPVSGPPFTLFAWHQNDTNLTQGAIVVLNSAGQQATLHRAFGDAQFIRYDGTGFVNIVSADAFLVTGTWVAVGMSAYAADSTEAFVNGVSVGTSATSANESLSRTRIAATDTFAAMGSFNDGRIACVAVWNVGLSAAEHAALAKGVSPLLIRRANLVAFWPLFGRTGTADEPAIVGTPDLTVSGDGGAGDNPSVVRIYAPRLRTRVVPVPLVPAAPPRPYPEDGSLGGGGHSRIWISGFVSYV